MKIYDGPTIIAGAAIFLILILFPLWYNALIGDAGAKPEPKLPTEYKSCVESGEYMKAYHMDLLNHWRDDYVRDNKRIHTAPDGTKYIKSLQHTCMKCHTSKEDFCDKCHDYAGVSPYCWDCHIQPEGF